MGIELQSVDVTVESDSDDRGLLGLGDGIPAGPLAVRVHVKLAARGVPRKHLEELVAWAEQHSPVWDATRRAIPTSTELEILEASRD